MPVTRQGTNDAMTPESIQAMIDRAIQRNSTHTQDDASQSSGEGLRRPMQPARVCSYTDFMKCQPLKFKGTEGITQNSFAVAIELANEEKVDDSSETINNAKRSKIYHGVIICNEKEDCSHVSFWKRDVNFSRQWKQPKDLPVTTADSIEGLLDSKVNDKLIKRMEIIRYPSQGKANVVADALSRKEWSRPLRVRALVMTMGLNLPKKILAKHPDRSIEAETQCLEMSEAIYAQKRTSQKGKVGTRA
ncbi:hypothetical protein Tco_1274353 [Tanacetum coccineum]